MSKILITGGAGFIGSHLAEKLLKNNNKLIIIDNFDDYYNPDIKKKNLSRYVNNKNVKFYEKDILNYNDIKTVFKKEKIEKVVHLAAKVGVLLSLQDPHIYEKVNLQGTVNILELSKEYNIKQILFASSSSVYGETKIIPFREDDLTIKPISPYGITKLCGEQYCYYYSKTYNIPITCLRFFTVYGPRQRPEMAIHKFTRKIFKKEEILLYGNGNSSRDYTYVDDITDGLVQCIKKPSKFEIYNLGNTHPIKLIKLIRLLEQKTRIKAKIKFVPVNKGEINITSSDISKAAKKLNYKPKTDIAEGVEKFVRWFKEEYL